jgi:hypothetical protein
VNKTQNVYTQKAIAQIPRLLSLQDRTAFSPTYGCFHRAYWLDKTSDFPDAVRQFATHALALVYTQDFPGNCYRGKTKIREWAIAGLGFWADIQHRDGSFDEFYPFERGWVGPTAFTTYAAAESLRLLGDEVPDRIVEKTRSAISAAAYFIASEDSEEDHLANHHAMAALAVWKAYRLLEEPALKQGFEQRWEALLTYRDDEGWFREYDGVDPGYLSATVSFIGKIYQDNPDPAILEVARSAIEFASYFVYPNGFYGGSLGSRNTLHFYPHGFEVFAPQIPVAGSIAEKMLEGLRAGTLVPPEIMSDRYVGYRVPEFLLSFLDYIPRTGNLPPLPYEREPFTHYYPSARIHIAQHKHFYIISNLAKGGVVKVFDQESGQLILNDSGIIGKTKDSKVITSQWVDTNYRCTITDANWQVTGRMNVVPSHKVFSLFKNLMFRGTLLLLGWIPAFSHFLKGSIRKTLILGQRSVPVKFTRRLDWSDKGITISNNIQSEGNTCFTSLLIGDEVFVRYVPQSRYFQWQELQVSGKSLTRDQLQHLNNHKHLTVTKQIRNQQETHRNE